RGSSAKRVLKHFTISNDAELVKRSGAVVKDLPLDATIRWRYKRGDKQYKMSEEQHSAASFYLLARLAKLGQEHVPGHDAAEHLALFSNEVHTGIDRTLETYRNLVTRPRRLDPRDAAALLAAIALHGDSTHAPTSGVTGASA
ncbi:MAG: hypothetical protein Q7K43_06040, partial [Candidatus Woesearchaeota archaeon]|nr:hypothetical protein [Candidatus Woesearchaeota archaeon]